MSPRLRWRSAAQIFRWRWTHPGISPECTAVLELAQFGDHLKEIQRLFGSRLHVVHQAALRLSPERVFEGIVDFLGAAPFPVATTFSRKNSAPGPRSGYGSNPGQGCCKHAGGQGLNGWLKSTGLNGQSRAQQAAKDSMHGQSIF